MLFVRLKYIFVGFLRPIFEKGEQVMYQPVKCHYLNIMGYCTPIWINTWWWKGLPHYFSSVRGFQSLHVSLDIRQNKLRNGLPVISDGLLLNYIKSLKQQYHTNSNRKHILSTVCTYIKSMSKDACITTLLVHTLLPPGGVHAVIFCVSLDYISSLFGEGKCRFNISNAL